MSFVKVVAVAVMECYASFAKGGDDKVLSGQRIATARKFEDSLIQAGYRQRVLAVALLVLLSGIIRPVALEIIEDELRRDKVLAYLNV